MSTLYIGNKFIVAKPMTRLAYTEYRGWGLSDDEEGTDEGYLVEYLDGGKPNHPDHAGYISWSPKEQFDNSYVAVGVVSSYPAYMQRVCAEKAQLIDRTEKLRNFLRTDAYHSMVKTDRQLLAAQLNIMESYRTVLEMRIQRFLEAQAE